MNYIKEHLMHSNTEVIKEKYSNQQFYTCFCKVDLQNNNEKWTCIKGGYDNLELPYRTSNYKWYTISHNYTIPYIKNINWLEQYVFENTYKNHTLVDINRQ